jgi:hypothetical protein
MPDPEFLFSSLLAMLHQSAMVQLGKIKNPATDAVERDMLQARLTIDLMQVLREKTEGNRTPDEEKLISTWITELQLNYVDELKKDEGK